ncbi:MAG: hypothetical protein ACRDPK_16730, partial [Carbonactinosporaceae bacterium]
MSENPPTGRPAGFTSGHSATDLVDPARLSAWAEGALPGDGPLEVSRHPEGHSNLTFVVARSRDPQGRQW